MNGKIKFFNTRERWGILIPENTKPGDRSTNVFFHENALEEGVKDGSLGDGAEIEFDLNPNWKKDGERKAIRVKPINSRSYAPVSEFRSNQTQSRGTHAGD